MQFTKYCPLLSETLLDDVSYVHLVWFIGFVGNVYGDTFNVVVWKLDVKRKPATT